MTPTPSRSSANIPVPTSEYRHLSAVSFFPHAGAWSWSAVRKEAKKNANKAGIPGVSTGFWLAHCILALLITMGAQTGRAQEATPGEAEEWSKLTPEQKSELRERYRAFQKLAPENGTRSGADSSNSGA